MRVGLCISCGCHVRLFWRRLSDCGLGLQKAEHARTPLRTQRVKDWVVQNVAPLSHAVAFRVIAKMVPHSQNPSQRIDDWHKTQGQEFPLMMLDGASPQRGKGTAQDSVF
jgi:hypothetical protein